MTKCTLFSSYEGCLEALDRSLRLPRKLGFEPLRLGLRRDLPPVSFDAGRIERARKQV